MSKIVFDSSALLALLNNEAGGEIVSSYKAQAIISTVNLAEVNTILLNMGMKVAEISNLGSAIVKEVIPFDLSQALHSASLKQANKSFGLSMGDCACISLAEIKGLPVLTADKIWKKANIKAEVILIR